MSGKTQKTPGFRNSVTFQAILLGAFTMVASVMLSFVDLGTRDAIVLRGEEDLKATIGQVVSNDLHDNDLLDSTISLEDAEGVPVTVYQATKEGQVTALAYAVNGFGYSGKITAIMAVDPQGGVLGVRILSHLETPGLGDKIEVKKDDWILGFNGLALGRPPAAQWAVKKDGGHFDQFSGATITPRAVVKAVKSGLEFFADNQKVLLVIIEKDEPVTEGSAPVETGDPEINLQDEPQGEAEKEVSQ